MRKKYRLRYLPIFEQDLANAIDYIAVRLQNPTAAQQLLGETEKAILNRLKAPLSFKAYYSNRDRKYAYYRIYVKNYAVFYVVIDDVMEVRRFVYNKRNLSELV
ncbi:hypothetical protein AGMMS50276_08990 [Synergistales bacterium]|nr:hypothetical protein AGMMS50276_08990 [Synergistales bacterium]